MGDFGFYKKEIVTDLRRENKKIQELNIVEFWRAEKRLNVNDKQAICNLGPDFDCNFL